MTARKFLVIVESPAKSKIIKKYLEKAFPGKTFDVEASFGHVRDLDKKELGVDLHTFVARYNIDPRKADVINRITKLVKACDVVLLASDNDREGEAIAWHLRDVLRLKPGKYHRMVFNEITEGAIKAAFLNLKSIDMDLVNAQQSRRIIDRIVGFKLSPLLWGVFKVENGTALSAGRVQSAALKYVVDRERDIEGHVSESYWTMKGMFGIHGRKEVIEDAKLYDKSIGGTMKRFQKISECNGFMAKLKGDFRIVQSRLHDSKTSPDAPFITSTLQQEANTKLGFSVKMTMGLAQQLYEKGLITYMRTDSFAISETATKAIGEYIKKSYGEIYLAERDYSSKRKVKNGQEAHEAIRPTDCSRDAINIGDDAMRRLYELIHKRTVASQMKQAVHSVLDVYIQDASMTTSKSKYRDCEFRGKFQALKDVGYLVVYNEKIGDIAWLTQLSEHIKDVKLDAREIHAKNTWSGAHSRFNEASIIKVMESDGVGRPSTYAGILEKLYSKNYVALQNTQGVVHKNRDLIWHGAGQAVEERVYDSVTNSEMNRLVPTEIGRRIHDFMEQNFADIIDKDFTSEMESMLDGIADGSHVWKDVLARFWKALQPKIEDAEKLTVRNKDREVLQVQRDEYNIDGIKYVVRLGKYGPLIEKIAVTKGDKKEFVGLVPYLRLVKKAYSELNEDEVRLLTSLPMRIGSTGQLRYGRYGFYVTYKEDNYMLPAKWVRTEFGGWENVGQLREKHLEIIKALKTEYLEKKKVKTKTLVKPKKDGVANAKVTPTPRKTRKPT